MEFSEGKTLYKEIMRLARSTSAARGYTQNAPGAIREAAEEIWKNRGMPGVFDVWWNTIHKIGISPLPNQAQNGTKPSTKFQNGPKPWSDWSERIINRLMRGGVVPEIKELADYEGITYDKAYDAVRRFKEAGGKLEKLPQGGGWKSTPPVPPAPPQPKVIQPAPDQAVVPAPSVKNGQKLALPEMAPPASQNGTDKALLAVLERMDKRLESIEGIMGPMFGTMKKLADAWCAGV